MIPGGTQLLSRRPEMFAPDQWPAYFREAEGCQIVDLDGKPYTDMSIVGIGSCLLGYRDPDVTQAVVQRVQKASMCTLTSPEEVELAALLLEINPWAQQVRYARCGGESMAVAVRIARAATKRSVVAFCGYHGWHDWYVSANVSTAGNINKLEGHHLSVLKPNGVPLELAGTALPFKYNQIGELEQIIAKHGNELAAVVMEPTRSVDPDPGFLEAIRQLCAQCGAVLIFDEVTIGWRFNFGGLTPSPNRDPVFMRESHRP
jgi:glutamate-1-semialdehyde 2,1-aminomutase